MSNELDTKTVEELKAYARDEDIDLGGATKKADIIAAIRAGGDVDDGKSTSPDLPSETRLDDHLDRPSTTAPGDGPADTTDPAERASSATPDKAGAAKAGHGTVNAVVPVGRSKRAKADKREDRMERYPARKPDGTVVTIERNIDTGASRIVD